MVQREADLGRALTSSGVLPLMLFLGALAMLLPRAALPAPVTDDAGGSALWKASYSERYPGCVSTALWPAAEIPVALLVMDSDGQTARVSHDEARVLAANGGLARMIGACRDHR